MSEAEYPPLREMKKALLRSMPSSVFYADLLDSLLEVHAHELAEKIRALDTSDQAEDRQWVGYGRPLRMAADLIDPEVT